MRLELRERESEKRRSKQKSKRNRIKLLSERKKSDGNKFKRRSIDEVRLGERQKLYS